MKKRRFVFRRRPEKEPTPITDTTLTTPVPLVDAVPIGPGLIYPDMLPENVWGSNLRGILSRSEWDRLRIPVCEAAGNRCEVCGQSGYDPETGRPRRPDCHELWHFEVTETAAVQRLARLIALCPDCHRVQHSGRASVKGELSLVVAQLQAVNSWNDKEIRLAFDNADDRYHWRRRFEWDLDLTLSAGKIDLADHPDLIIPASKRSSLGNSYG
jgi:hypothetical protein